MTSTAWFEYLIEAANNTAEDEAMDAPVDRSDVEARIEPDHLLHLALTWADAGQLTREGEWRNTRLHRKHVRVSDLLELAINAMYGTHLELSGGYIYLTDSGRAQLAEWDALVAGEPEPVPPVAKRGPELTAYQRMTGTGDGVDTPTCLDDLCLHTPNCAGDI